MYYQKDASFELDNYPYAASRGMGFLPLIPLILGATAIAPSIISLFHKEKKEKKPKGPTPAQIAEQQRLQMLAQEAANRKKMITYGAIGIVALVAVGGAAVYYAKRKKKR